MSVCLNNFTFSDLPIGEVGGAALIPRYLKVIRCPPCISGTHTCAHEGRLEIIQLDVMANLLLSILLGPIKVDAGDCLVNRLLGVVDRILSVEIRNACAAPRFNLGGVAIGLLPIPDPRTRLHFLDVERWHLLRARVRRIVLLVLGVHLANTQSARPIVVVDWK